MKKIISIALMLAAAVAGATGYEDWFTPQKGWSGYKVPVHIQFQSSHGIDFEFLVTSSLSSIIDTLNAAAESDGVPPTAKNAYIVSITALANSIFAACQAQINKVKIDNLGAALEGVFVSTYGQYEDEDGNVLSKSKSGVDTSKLRQQLLANKNSIIAGGKAAGGSESNPLTIVITQKPYDERQFEQHIESGRSLTSLHGWYGLSDDRRTNGLSGANDWALADKDYYIPYSTGKSSTLGWIKWNGWDAGCLSAGDDIDDAPNDKPLRLRGWTTANNCNESIQNLLTNETETAATDRSRHKILTRYDDGKGARIHWMPFDNSIIGGEGHADDKSIILAQDEGASSEAPKKFRLKGFDAAKPEQATDGAVLPFVDTTSDDLQWGGMENFFADSVFRKSSTTGKMLLNGTTENGKVSVITMTGTGGDDQHVAALAFDARSVDGINGVVQVHGFNTAPSPFGDGLNFTDALTNMSVSIANMSIPLRVPASDGGYEMKYAPLAKVTGIPVAPVDNKTIEINETDPENKFLQLYGAAGEGITLKEGDVYQIGSDGKGKFAKLGADDDDATVESANASIETYIGDDGGKYFRLRDWMLNREGLPHLLGWEEHALKYWEVTGAGGIDITDDPAGDSIHLSNFEDANNGAIPYALTDGNGLGWLNGVDGRVPLLHTAGAPTSMAIGSSLDTANISAVPTLNVANFTSGGNCTAKLNKILTDPNESVNRSAHQFMARYTGNGAPIVHWMGIDDIIAGGNGAPVDDASITTNTAHGAVTSGYASIYGFADAPVGTTPFIANVSGQKVLRWGTTGSFGLIANKVSDGWNYTVGSGYYQKARSAIFLAGSRTFSSSGWVYLKVPTGNTISATLEQDASSVPASTSSYTYIPLYYLDKSAGVQDYRYMPHIQVWE